MIQLDPQIIAGLKSVQSPGDLYYYLRQAVKLEHSTIPPYLTAMFSLKDGVNRRIGQLIHSIVVEEMLHMTIASNVLIAIGGNPEINAKDFVPDYPGHLPMSIGDLTVGIEAFSPHLVKHKFMKIEEPEDPIPVEPPKLMADAALPHFSTIGQFYDAIQEQIRCLGDGIFNFPTAPPQIVSSKWFPPEKLFPIVDVESACRAIDIIKIEGEGTPQDPFQTGEDPAHYYKFGSIYYGREIIRDGEKFAYQGAPILFDPAGVWPLKPNCKIADFKVGTQARTRIESFAYSYSALLNALHQVFNGKTDCLDAAIGMMYDLRVLSVALMQTDAGDATGQTVGPSFEFIDVQGGM